MSLKKFRRSNGIWHLRGTVRGIYIYESTKTSDEEIAEAIRIKTEDRLLNESVFGKEAVWTFAEAVVKYLEAAERSDATKRIVERLLEHFGTRLLRSVDQLAVDDMYKALIPSGSIHSKIGLVTILNAILELAARRGMCPRPLLEKPKAPDVKRPFLYPEQATALARASPPHLRPLVVFLVSVGCRPDEALALDWLTVDLRGAQVILTLGKVNIKEHAVALRPVTLHALNALPHRKGPVFRTWLDPDREPPIGPAYAAGRITTAWETACVKAGLPGEWKEWTDVHGVRRMRFAPVHNPYSMRHTFATWHRCAIKDIQDLRDEIGWTTTRMAERYSKKMSKTYEGEILEWWDDRVDLGLDEVEEVSCKIRAGLGLTPLPRFRKAS